MISIIFDGGSIGNHQKGEPREGYGSFAVINDRTVVRSRRKGRSELVHRLEFGDTTNNEAEWLAAEEALMYIVELAGRTERRFSISIVGDSQNVIGALLGDQKTKAANLRPIRARCEGLVSGLRGAGHNINFVRTGRDEVVRILGH